MKDLSIPALLIVSAVLVTLSMLFSISESSFLGVNRLRLNILRKKNDKRAIRVSKLLEKKEILINTLLIANEIVNILLSAIITAVSLKIFGSKGVGIATVAVTIFLLIFGEITPKTLSTRNPDSIAFALSGFVKIVVIILSPVVFLLTAVSRFFLLLRGVKSEKNKPLYSEEDIKSFIEISEENGILEKGENSMMKSVFTFSDLEAQDIMIPRTNVIALKSTSTYSQVLEIAQRTRCSYFPVYKENLDHVIGVLYLRDLLKVNPENFNIKNEMRSPLFIPATMKISSVQHLMRRKNESIGIVIDEYSGTDGIITKHHIIQEIFGTDENSKPWRGSCSVKEISSSNVNIVSGATLLSELNQTGIKLKSDINETLGGWIIEQLGHLALPFDSVTYDGIVFTVEKIQKRRIETVRIEKAGTAGQENE